MAAAPTTTPELDQLILKTQEILQPLVAKPKLADKLLQKPPFRFLHDVFTAVITSTGFAKGLFTEEESDSANVKEKQQKIDYLNKMINCVGLALNKEIDVRSAKIVAGLEPENTNIFLQSLASAALSDKTNFSKLVERTLSGEIATAASDKQIINTTPSEVKRTSSPNIINTISSNNSDNKTTNLEKKEEEEKQYRISREKEKEKEKMEEEKKRNDEIEANRLMLQKEKEKEKMKQEQELRPVNSVENQIMGNNIENKGNNSERGTIRSNNNGSIISNEIITSCDGNIEKTQELMGNLITKPKMASKLLQKPPFRFLHDIITEVIEVTGFAKGLFNSEEMDSSTITEKNSKINYLNKIIQYLNNNLNIEIEAKPAKIVAGLEPELTNKFLQLLAIAAKPGISEKSVQNVVKPDNGNRDIGFQPVSKQVDTIIVTENKIKTSEMKFTEEKEKIKSENIPKTSRKDIITSPEDEEEKLSNNNNNSNLENSSENIEGINDSKPIGRPTTARRKPPKLRDNVKEAGRMITDVSVAPPKGIIRDGVGNDSDEEEIDNKGIDNNSNNNDSIQDNKYINNTKHGKLVRDILEDESKLQEKEMDEKDKDKDKDKEEDQKAGTGIRLGKKKLVSDKKTFSKTSSGSGASGLTLNEMNQLRISIQKLCQAANPLAKCLEYIHEDMDAMTKELEFWRTEYHKKSENLEEEKKKTEEAIQPLEIELLEAEEKIKDQIQKINMMKASIAKKDERIQNLLRLIVAG